jgi:hypothetical protein
MYCAMHKKSMFAEYGASTPARHIGPVHRQRLKFE